MIKKTKEPQISIITFCHNNENNIKEHLENLSFAQEIIFIDDNSSDNTVTVTRESGAKVIVLADECKQEQEVNAIKEAKNNWIILLELNEYLSNELKAEILLEISNPDTAGLHYVRETLFFFGKTIKYGAFYNKSRVLLFDKKRYSYTGKQQTKHMQASKTLKNRINSCAYKNFDDYNYNLNLLRKEEAQLLFHKNVKPNFYHFFMKPFFNFVHQYFLKLGFVDGKEGYILAYINSFSILKRYLILWLLYYEME